MKDFLIAMVLIPVCIAAIFFCSFIEKDAAP